MSSDSTLHDIVVDNLPFVIDVLRGRRTVPCLAVGRTGADAIIPVISDDGDRGEGAEIAVARTARTAFRAFAVERYLAAFPARRADGVADDLLALLASDGARHVVSALAVRRDGDGRVAGLDWPDRDMPEILVHAPLAHLSEADADDRKAAYAALQRAGVVPAPPVLH
jgi:hypothetical protein